MANLDALFERLSTQLADALSAGEVEKADDGYQDDDQGMAPAMPPKPKRKAPPAPPAPPFAAAKAPKAPAADDDDDDAEDMNDNGADEDSETEPKFNPKDFRRRFAAMEKALESIGLLGQIEKSADGESDGGEIAEYFSKAGELSGKIDELLGRFNELAETVTTHHEILENVVNNQEEFAKASILRKSLDGQEEPVSTANTGGRFDGVVRGLLRGQSTTLR